MFNYLRDFLITYLSKHISSWDKPSLRAPREVILWFLISWLTFKFIKRDYLFFNATVDLFKNVWNVRKQQLYYALCARHPFQNGTLFSIAEMISADQRINGILQLFLQLMSNYESLNVSTLTPMIIIIDWSTAIMGSLILVYNKSSTKEYLSQWFKYLTRKGTELRLSNLILFIWSAHFLNRVKSALKGTKYLEFFSMSWDTWSVWLNLITLFLLQRRWRLFWTQNITPNKCREQYFIWKSLLIQARLTKSRRSVQKLRRKLNYPQILLFWKR